MELSILILQEIVSMFLMIMVGFVLIRAHIVPKDIGSYLSKIVLYIVLPCTIINAFQIESSPEVVNGLIFAFAAALIANILLVVVPYLFKNALHLNSIEQASISYPNSGEILIPLVASVLSKEMQVYCCGFLICQIIFIFTHGVTLISGEKNISIRSILKNVNVIAIFIGLILFVTNIQIPSMIGNTIDSFAKMVAPMCMLVIGCAIGNSNLKEKIKNKRIYLVVVIRQIITPILFLLLIKVSHITVFMANAKEILLVVFMATCSSTAATVANIAQSYDKDAEYASIINVVGVIVLIVTLPVMVLLYQMII